MTDESDLSVGERIQNAKTAYDRAVDDHALVDCDLCGEETSDARAQDVQNEQTGARMTVDLCPTCRDVTDRYNRGEATKEDLKGRMAGSVGKSDENVEDS
jgi:hypothetical protein